MGAQKLKCIDKWAVDIDEIGVFLEGSSIARATGQKHEDIRKFLGILITLYYQSFLQQ